MFWENVELSPAYLVNTNGTSDGTQDKYFKNNIWYKTDRFGGEGEAERLATILMECSSLEQNEFVHYDRVRINGEAGCSSANFLSGEESFVTIYRLYSNVCGGDIARRTATMDYDDGIEFVLRFVKEQTGLDLHRYLANTFALDRIILNEDRNFNNFGVIFDGTKFREAPIFDNGKSFFVGNKKIDLSQSFEENIKKTFAKSFSGSFELNYNYLKEYGDFTVDLEELEKRIAQETQDEMTELLMYQVRRVQMEIWKGLR
jgi:hypothetical protein